MFPREYFTGSYFPDGMFPPVVEAEAPVVILMPPSEGWSDYQPYIDPEDEEVILMFLATRFPH